MHVGYVAVGESKREEACPAADFSPGLHTLKRKILNKKKKCFPIEYVCNMCKLTCDVSTDNTQLSAPVRTSRLYIGRGPGRARYSSPARLHKMLGEDVRPGLQMRQTRHGRLQQVSPDVTLQHSGF